MNSSDLANYYSCSNGAPAIRWRLEQGGDGTPFDSCPVYTKSANVAAGSEVAYMFFETGLFALIGLFLILIVLITLPQHTLDRMVMGR